jgi:ADP-ribose pyrophosphatase
LINDHTPTLLPTLPRNLKETCLQSTLAYEGNFLKLRRDRVQLPTGAIHEREYLIHPGAVAILAELPTGNLLLERQFRYPPRREFIEIPAGKIDPHEDILETAKRELLEETGYTASEWTHLTQAWPCIGYADERLEYFLARGLVYQGQQPDEGELLEVFELPLKEALDWIRQGKINDSKTIVGLFWLEKYLTGWAR